jgi:hypothetical protein
MSGISDVLGERSSLTEAQIKTLVLHLAVSRGEFPLKEALGMRERGTISRGTHYRILSQAKANVIRGIFTVSLAVNLGLVKQGELDRFLLAVGKIPPEISPHDAANVMSLVDTLATRLVML